jgi:hypothetical protein
MSDREREYGLARSHRAQATGQLLDHIPRHRPEEEHRHVQALGGQHPELRMPERRRVLVKPLAHRLGRRHRDEQSVGQAALVGC